MILPAQAIQGHRPASILKAIQQIGRLPHSRGIIAESAQTSVAWPAQDKADSPTLMAVVDVPAARARIRAGAGVATDRASAALRGKEFFKLSRGQRGMAGPLAHIDSCTLGGIASRLGGRFSLLRASCLRIPPVVSNCPRAGLSAYKLGIALHSCRVAALVVLVRAGFTTRCETMQPARMAIEKLRGGGICRAALAALFNRQVYETHIEHHKPTNTVSEAQPVGLPTYLMSFARNTATAPSCEEAA